MSDDDLHTSDNPYAQGRPATERLGSDFPNAAPLGYWTNPATDPRNPNSDGSTLYTDDSRSSQLTADLAGEFDRYAAINLGNLRDGGGPNPTGPYELGLLADEGQDDQDVPASHRS